MGGDAQQMKETDSAAGRIDGTTAAGRNHGIRGIAACALLALAATAFGQSPDQGQEALEPLRFQGYPDAPEFSVVPRKDELFFYPCSQCHDNLEPSGEIRELMAPHDVELEHGNGRIWCLSCHSLDTRNYLSSLLEERIDFDSAYLLCGNCHPFQQKDWYYGAHGKRVDNWQGQRTLTSCTGCHDAHSPTIKPRAPKPVPPVRAGLDRPEGEKHHRATPWERRQPGMESAESEH